MNDNEAVQIKLENTDQQCPNNLSDGRNKIKIISAHCIFCTQRNTKYGKSLKLGETFECSHSILKKIREVRQEMNDNETNEMMIQVAKQIELMKEFESQYIEDDSGFSHLKPFKKCVESKKQQEKHYIKWLELELIKARGEQKPNQNVKQIIQSRLTELGADGLWNEAFQKGFDILALGEGSTWGTVKNCVPGYRDKDGKIHPDKEQ
jgi:hypothetical protein